MFGIMGIGSAFMKVSGRGGRKKINKISFIPTIDDPVIYKLSCNGNIIVSSIKNGEAITETYNDLSNTQVSVQADANTNVTIKGDVTYFSPGYDQGWQVTDYTLASSYNIDNSVLVKIEGITGVASGSQISVTENITLNCSALQNFSISKCAVTSLDFSKCQALVDIKCLQCANMTSLDLSANTALTSLNCNNCTALTSLDLSANTALTSLTATGDSITSLDLSANTALTSLNLTQFVLLTSLDLSANTALTSISCTGWSSLAALDLSANTALTSLNCNNCAALTSLDLSANTALTSLNCNNCTALTSLDLSANTALTSLSSSGCKAIVLIKYPGTNNTVSGNIGSMITNANATNGTIYCDQNTSGYSAISTAATNKGWTIEQL